MLDVGYDPERRLWYCDVTIDSRDSRSPMKRLVYAEQVEV